MRAMVIGFPKSGTTTIHRACERSGLHSAHWRTPDGFCGKLIYESFCADKDPLERLAEYDVIAQADVCLPPSLSYWPNLDFSVLGAVRRYHPECLFILNRRDPRKIVDSISRWTNFRQRIVRANIIGLPSGIGAKDHELQKWIEDHYAACSEKFAQDPHYIDVDIEAEDAQMRLAAALGWDLRWWGVANRARPADRAQTVRAASSGELPA
jgi:hypothetical protein